MNDRNDHWQHGDPDLPRRASDLSLSITEAEVILVQVYRDADAEADAEQDGMVLAELWREAIDASTGSVHGRRLGWRGFVLLVEGDSATVREAIVEATDAITARQAGPWQVSARWMASSGDFIEDVKRLETEAGRGRS